MNLEPRNPHDSRAVATNTRWRRRAAVFVATAILVATLAAGCGFSYDPVTGRYSGAVGCVNLTGPGFTLACPDTLQAPPVPNTPQPTPH